jgi:hypothetical protein
MKLIRRAIYRLLKPLLRSIVNEVQVDDLWERYPKSISAKKFGRGNTHEWAWYHEGKSDVQIKSIKELCRWLDQCRYAYDMALFNEEDYWQHPLTFETTRKGDCEDHALWAWRKLMELGYEAELVIGYYIDDRQHLKGRHAAVVFGQNKRRYFLDGVRKGGPSKMVFSLAKAADFFCPEISVGADFKTYRYHGSLVIIKQGLNKKN